MEYSAMSVRNYFSEFSKYLIIINKQVNEWFSFLFGLVRNEAFCLAVR